MKQNQQLANELGKEPIKHESMYLNEQFENSSVWVRGNQEEGYYATLGKHRITEAYESKEEVESLLIHKDMDTLINIMTAVVMTIQAQQAEEIEAMIKEQTFDTNQE